MGRKFEGGRRSGTGDTLLAAGRAGARHADVAGFRNELEREFFERLLSVPKLGVRGALQLFAVPMATLARAIEDNTRRR
jgi:hypothetical protein